MFNKKYIVLIVIAILIGPLNFFVEITSSSYQNSNYETICFTYNFEKPILRSIMSNNHTFTRIEVKNLPLSIKYGKPIVPEKHIKLLLPYSKTVGKILVESIDSNILEDESLKNIQLGYKTQHFSDSYNEESTTEISLYDKNCFYPNNIFTNIGVQYKDGFPILFLNLYPVQYLDKDKIIQYCRKIKITIELTPDNENDIFHKERFRNDIEKFVDNPQLLNTYPENSATLGPNENPQFAQYDYVIITTDDIKNPSLGYPYTFDDLISYRESQGLSCTYKTIEEIQNEYNGIDLQEKIRNFIKDAYENWNTKWILLGGDIEKVPIRFLTDIDGQEKDETSLASDLYYQCLDGNYNYDGDTLWGEEFDGVNGQRIDLLAEVYIGRAPIDDDEDLSAFVEKTLSYENSQWEEDDYLQRILSAGEKIWSGAGGFGAGYVERCIDYCEDYDQETYGIPSDQYTIIELYERDELWYDDDVINVINNGINMINHVGHGTSVSTMQLSSIELNELNNTDKYCLFYTQACHTGQLEKLDECFAEKWVNIPKKGGFAAIMNTGYGYGSTEDYDGADNRYAREFFDALFSPHEKIARIGEANQDSKEDNIWHINDDNMYHAYYDTTLFGDPYVSIKGAEEASAEFSWFPEYPNTGEIINFYDESLGMTTFRKWEFSDGYISYEKNPKHVFSKEKTYKVTLTVMDKHGYISTKTKSVEVKEQWNPIAEIYPQNYNGFNFTIHFSGSESWDPDGNIIRYSWDFDDGNTSDLCETVHTYDSEGTYYVSLLVEDDDGNFDRAFSTIVISQQFPPDKPTILNGSTSTFSGEITNFSVVSTDFEGNNIQYGINWGDGNDLEWTDWYISGEVCTLYHMWNNIGNYKVKIKARDSNYGESNWSDELIVVVSDEKDPFLEIQKPVNGIYVSNEKKIPFVTPLVFGSIDIQVFATDASGIDRVLFFIDDKINPVAEVLSEPYKYTWDKISFNRHNIKIVAIDTAGKQSSYETTVWKFF